MVIEKKINTASVNLKSLHPLDHSLELLHFGFRGLTVEADRFLEARGLSRVHHRILYVIARADAISVGELAITLGVSNQALHRPLSHLFEQALVQYSREPGRHRFKLLALSEAGTALEAEATELERRTLRDAFATTDADGQDAWRRVMLALAEHLN
ncbi:transcriptional regulator [Ectopseudomonas toyotomiensis]|uniref:DNA-binding transcriptional regulator, MarR family n=1 Tax=Ectopseudomonas toyotomiensis TaxID=554344 RepID=A0A1I5T9Z5_9GAMM|nr:MULTISPECIES: MarR family transcriptional regulator [Pseudomonas]PIA74031.1 transcriptional regulator [Pseudomonas toyotomiensis]SDA46795.1 DNA-binding transcriptional regulator, MarR family [Pseudomonas sp. NFPP33]SFP79256.1 DNA-binding transcriptional regulator, MarR family [Pseudomonas toyotomiensis]